MAEFTIDQNKLPGVKEVCRDFAVLEDHCLAHNLQEQEIESHLASNVHKSRLVQQDLQVAKKLQEEEDKQAKVQNQRQFRDIERQDNEIAQEIQEELVRQAEQQRQQEEKDAAIARKLQEKLMKEERKRQKQLEANFEEEYFEDQGAARGLPHDLDKPSRHGSGSSDRHSPSRHDEPIGSHREHSPEYNSVEPKRSRYPKQDPVAPHSRSRYPEHYPPADGGRSRHADPYPEHLLSPRGKHKDRYPDYQPTETGRVRGQRGDEVERVVRRKDRPARPPAPHIPVERDRDRRERDYDREGNRLGDRERDKTRDREKGRNVERDMGRDQRRDRDDPARRDKERDIGTGQKGDKARERDRQRQKDREGHGGRTRSRERVLEEEPVPGHSRDLLREEVEMVDDLGDGERERRARGRHCVYPGPGEVFEEHRSNDGRGERDPRDGEGPSRERSDTDSSRETGRLVQRGGGPVVADGVFGLKEATQGLTRLDIREQEIIDMEVARKLQEEELKASKIDKRAAQVAQDEEIARLLMEQEKKVYKKNKEKEREKEKDRERLAMERMAMERRRHEGEHRPSSEEVVRPRTREEHEHQRQRNHNKPSRPPQPRTHDYENVNNSPYGYSENPFTPRAPSRPEAAYKGAYYRQ